MELVASANRSLWLIGPPSDPVTRAMSGFEVNGCNKSGHFGLGLNLTIFLIENNNILILREMEVDVSADWTWTGNGGSGFLP